MNSTPGSPGEASKSEPPLGNATLGEYRHVCAFFHSADEERGRGRLDGGAVRSSVSGVGLIGE
jgi:hypothetical protein